MLGHNFLVDVLVGLLSKNEIVPHLFEHFCEGNKEVVFDLFDVRFCEPAVELKFLLDGSVHFSEVVDHLLHGVWLKNIRRAVFLCSILVELLQCLLWVHLMRCLHDIMVNSVFGRV